MRGTARGWDWRMGRKGGGGVGVQGWVGGGVGGRGEEGLGVVDDEGVEECERQQSTPALNRSQPFWDNWFGLGSADLVVDLVVGASSSTCSSWC